VGGSDDPGSSGVIPPEEEMHTPLMTRSRTEVGSSDFNATHFYQYMDDHFFRLNLRLNAIDEHQQQQAKDQHELLRQQRDFDRRHRRLEHHVYYAYEDHD